MTHAIRTTLPPSSWLRRTARTAPAVLAISMAVAAAMSSASCDSGPNNRDRSPGQTEFESEEGSPSRGPHSETAGPAGGLSSDNATGAPAAAPNGRTGPVEEADIYRVDQNRLFYLNTYRGFLIYDLADPKNPREISRLPVYGHPVEMFVQGNVVYALLASVLYMTEAQGQVRFERHNVSQLVAIDISDLAHPAVLQSVDIVGELREGVSRKIDDTIYVVSYIPQAYYWGWRYELPGDPQKEQAWVYSFNVSDPRNLTLVQRLKIFEGGSVADRDPVTGGEVTRSFSDVAISATSNALMVVENWQLSSWSPGKDGTMDGTNQGQYICGRYAGDQRAVVSLIDISDPAGAIRLHAHFQTRGTLGDQFKQTYVFDEAARTGTYYGIFARQAWLSTGCSGQSYIQNTFESWDVSTAGAPARLGSLDFGKPNETVRGTAFDVGRKVAYAITAQQIDPLYVLGFADPANPRIRSAIDGLSGDMSLFRLVEGNNFLVGIGRDTSTSCTGFQDGSASWHNVGVAVSLIDVRNLDAVRLVQRQCVAVDGDWVSSAISWNMDQAHKLIGLQTDGSTNVITVPVSYAKRSADNAQGWWWYGTETAVGIMSWDVSQYDPTKPPAAQTVIKNFGTYVHPNGEVRRSVIFTHQGATPRRMMINLSDTHVSVADIQDLAHPIPQAVVEVAPYVERIFKFGDYVVESVPAAGSNAWYGQQGLTEFRVKRAGTGTDLDRAPVVARFSAAQVQSVIPHGDKLVVFRVEQDAASPNNGGTTATNILVFDLADPTTPRLVGNTRTTGLFYPYYPFLCGVGWGYWFNYGQTNWTDTADALIFLEQIWDFSGSKAQAAVVSINLADAANPTVSRTAIPARERGYFQSLVPDAADRRGFFLTYADYVGPPSGVANTPTRIRNYAQRFHRAGEGWVSEQALNLPGQLVRTWNHPAGARAYLTSDYVNYALPDGNGGTQWRSDTRLNLLRATTTTGGRTVAELRATHRFADQSVSDLVIDDNALFVNVSPVYGYAYGYGYGATEATSAAPLTADQLSDRLVAFDMTNFDLTSVYDQPTGTQGVQFMGTYRGQLFLNVGGDGILAVDVADPARPVGRQFLRTLGWATHIVFVGDDAYVAAGYFGVYRMGLKDEVALPVTN